MCVSSRRVYIPHYNKIIIFDLKKRKEKNVIEFLWFFFYFIKLYIPKAFSGNLNIQ